MLTYLVISSKEESGRRRRNIHKLRKARASEKKTRKGGKAEMRTIH